LQPKQFDIGDARKSVEHALKLTQNAREGVDPKNVPPPTAPEQIPVEPKKVEPNGDDPMAKEPKKDNPMAGKKDAKNTPMAKENDKKPDPNAGKGDQKPDPLANAKRDTQDARTVLGQAQSQAPPTVQKDLDSAAKKLAEAQKKTRQRETGRREQ